MSLLNFEISQCTKNPRRWYVYLKIKRPFDLEKVNTHLQGLNYSRLIDTPSVSVFRSESIKLTWHRRGLIQLDTNKDISFSKADIEQLIKQILNDNTCVLFG
ncbi:MAG: hypothetical protein ACTSPG_00880 [Candidatus Hodarchaeales archaeon]